MPLTREPIIRRKLSDEVFDRLKALITTGKLSPGDLFPSERELMDWLSVGRPAIREAMQQLSTLGLLTISHGERARVRHPTARSIFQQVDDAANMLLSSSPTSLENLKEARRFFELGMVRQAAHKADARAISDLQKAVDDQRSHLGNADAFINADMAFHTRIAAISGNPLFEAMSEAMLGWLKQYHTDLLIWTGKENHTLSEHEEILGRIIAHDPDGAERAMARHLDRSASLYVHQGAAAG